MDRNTPPIDSPPRFAPYIDDAESSHAWRQSIRARLFALSFGITLVAGLAWTLLQPVIYRSSATVLMSAPSAIDADFDKVNIQSVAIQSRILLGTEVTQGLLDQLTAREYADVDSSYLRSVLHVEALPETNLVEMVAQGSDARILPALVNQWIDVYLAIRANNVQDSQTQTLEVVEDQLGGLAQRVEEARQALATYRTENHISSVDRQQNEALAQFDGLNTALKSAVQKEVETGAKLDSLRNAIAAGKNVVSPSERKSVESMEKELRDLQTRLIKLKKTYTMNYILNQPSLRDIPERAAELEGALDGELTKGKDLVLAQAEQEHAAALQTVENLQAKLRVQEQQAALFTTVYTRHEALAKDLAELETLYRETQSRLVQVQVNQVEKYPQVAVIDRPDSLSERVGPDYLIWLGGSLAAALGMGVLSVWLYGFLGPRPAKPAYITLSGVHMYPQEVSGQLTYSAQDERRLARSETPLLRREEPTGYPPEEQREDDAKHE